MTLEEKYTEMIEREPIVTLRSPGYLSPGDTAKLLKLCAISDVPLYTHPASASEGFKHCASCTDIEGCGKHGCLLFEELS